MGEAFLESITYKPRSVYYNEDDIIIVDNNTFQFYLPDGVSGDSYWSACCSMIGKGRDTSGNYVYNECFVFSCGISNRPEHGISCGGGGGMSYYLFRDGIFSNETGANSLGSSFSVYATYANGAKTLVQVSMSSNNPYINVVEVFNRFVYYLPCESF